MDTTTAAHECITGVLDLLERAQRLAGAPDDRIAVELLAVAETAEAVGGAPDTDPVVGADARELASAARAAALAIAATPSARSLLAA